MKLDEDEREEGEVRACGAGPAARLLRRAVGRAEPAAARRRRSRLARAAAGRANRQRSWLQRLPPASRARRRRIARGVVDIFTKRKLDAASLDDLEDVLIQADLGLAAAARIREAVARGRYERGINPDEVKRDPRGRSRARAGPGRAAARRSTRTSGRS